MYGSVRVSCACRELGFDWLREHTETPQWEEERANYM